MREDNVQAEEAKDSTTEVLAEEVEHRAANYASKPALGSPTQPDVPSIDDQAEKPQIE